MGDPWTDRLSDYLDEELPPLEAERLERHLDGCAECRQVLTELRAVVQRARGLGEREPPRDLWPEIAARIGVAATPAHPAAASEGHAASEAQGPSGSARGEASPPGAAPASGHPGAPGHRSWAERADELRERRHRRLPRRFSFSLPQLAAAAIAIVLLSGSMVWLMTSDAGMGGEGGVAVDERAAPGGEAVLAGIDERARAGGYDDAVAQLETILFYGEEALDPATVRTLRESLDSVDRAIAEARTALADDPGNSYLQQHLGDTMRKKAEFLRQAVTLVATDR